MFSPSTRSHYLNITPNNVVRVYCKDLDGKLSTDKTSSFKREDFAIPVCKPAPKPHTLSSPNAGKLSNLIINDAVFCDVCNHVEIDMLSLLFLMYACY